MQTPRALPLTASLFLIGCGFAAAGLDAEPAPADRHLLKKVGEFHLLSPRMGAAVVARDNYVYVIGGSAGSAVADIERFDVRTHQIVRVTDKLLARRYHNAVEYDGRIYIFGGEGFVLPTEAYESRVEIFDCATGKLTEGAQMPVARGHMAAAKLGSKVYLAGGSKVVEKSGIGLAQTADCDIYDLVSGAWSKGPPLPTPREASGVAVGDFMIVLGGFRAKRSTDQIEVLDPRPNTWRTLPALSRSISANSAAFLDRYVFLFGDYGKLGSVVAYELKTRATIEVQTEFTGVRHSAATVLQNLIYVVGGTTMDSNGESDLIQVFALNPATMPTVVAPGRKS